MAEGRSNAGIGRQLWVTEGTVEKHVRSILMKLRLPETADDHRRVLGVGSAGSRARRSAASRRSERDSRPGPVQPVDAGLYRDPRHQMNQPPWRDRQHRRCRLGGVGKLASGNIAERQMSFGGFCHGLFFLDQKIVELGSWG
jgi:hypothetical protein